MTLKYWTKEIPIKEGWYFWRKNKRNKDSFRWSAWFITFDNEENIEGYLDGVSCHLPNGGWWAGPIAEPEVK